MEPAAHAPDEELEGTPGPWAPMRCHSEELYPYPIEDRHGLVVAVADTPERAERLAAAPTLARLVPRLLDAVHHARAGTLDNATWRHLEAEAGDALAPFGVEPSSPLADRRRA